MTPYDEVDRILLESCHPKQRVFVLDRGRRVSALVGRGGGKTTGGRVRLVRRLRRTPRARCLYIATTRQQAEDLMWGQLKDLLERLGVEADYNETKLRCTLRRNGSTLKLVGADDKREVDKLRGQPFHEVGIDEAASFPILLMENLLYRIIGPRLGDYGGMIWLIGTPGHDLRGTFYDATRPGGPLHFAHGDPDRPADWSGWSSHAWTLQDGAEYVPAMARLWAEALVEKRENGWSDDNPIWLREYLGRWAADDTERMFRYLAERNQWDPERKNGFAVLPLGDDGKPREWSYVYGVDLGSKDPFALEVFAWCPADPNKRLYHAYEFARRGMYPRTIAQLLLGDDLNVDKPAGVIGHTGWPDAMDADLAGNGGAILDELSNVYGIRMAPAEKKNKLDAIEMFNGDLLDGRIKILKGSELENQLVELQWALDEYGRLREPKGCRNDCTDAAVYARRRAQHLFAQVAEPPPPILAPRRDPIEEDEAEEVPNDDFRSILYDRSYKLEF